LQSIDEYVLWDCWVSASIVANPEATLLATPTGSSSGWGWRWEDFNMTSWRASLERIALAAYQNTAFYNPVSQQHERITLHFFSSYLPTKGQARGC